MRYGLCCRDCGCTNVWQLRWGPPPTNGEFKPGAAQNQHAELQSYSGGK
jgi:hypothetical protein